MGGKCSKPWVNSQGPRRSSHAGAIPVGRRPEKLDPRWPKHCSRTWHTTIKSLDLVGLVQCQKKTGKYQSPPQKTVSHMIKGSQIVCLIGWPIVTSTQLSSTTTGRFTGKRHRTVMVQLASARRTHRWMKETRDHRVVQHGGDRFDSAPLGC